MNYVPRSRSTDQRYYGVVEAIVVDNEDKDGEGKIQVSFPWFDGDETNPSGRMVTECRVAQLYAGDGYGAMFCPEKGMEVVVAFIHGDMRYPIIVGGIYNGVDKPPRTKSKSLDPKYIRTKAGHQIILDDTKGSQKIEVIDAKGENHITIDTEANTITVRSKMNLTVEATEGELALKGRDVRIEADGGNVNVSGTMINLN